MVIKVKVKEMRLSDCLEKGFETGSYDISQWDADGKKNMVPKDVVASQMEIALLFVEGKIGILERKVLGPWRFVLKYLIDKGEMKGILDVLDVYELRKAVEGIKQGQEALALSYFEKEKRLFSRKEKLKFLMREACKAGNLDLVQKLYEQGAKLSTSFFEDKMKAPMSQAALMGRKEVVEFLLKKGVSHFFLDKAHKEGFKKVGKKDYQEKSELILKDGALYKEKQGTQEAEIIQKIVHESYQARLPEVIDLLMENPLLSFREKAIDMFNKYIRRRDSLGINTLLDLGVSLEATDLYGLTPLEAAVQTDDLLFLRTMQEKGLLSDLAKTAREGDLFKVIDSFKQENWGLFLIRNGQGLKDQAQNGQTPLMAAIQFKRGMIFEELLAKEVDLNQQDFQGWTALFYALRAFEETKKYLPPLVKQGILLNHQNKEGETALMMAIMLNCDQAAKYLIEQGADVLVKNNEGFDAYNLAMQRGNIEIVGKIRDVLRQQLIEKRNMQKIALNAQGNMNFLLMNHINIKNKELRERT